MPDEDKLAHDDPTPTKAQPRPTKAAKLAAAKPKAKPARKVVYYVKGKENREATGDLKAAAAAALTAPSAPIARSNVRAVKPKS